MSKIEVASGQLLDLADPAPHLIHVEDIAHALSNLCRFTGHLRRFYSVAEHATLVADILQKQGHDAITQYAGLHHDDQEAYIGDVSTPLKGLLPEYRTIEARVTAAVDLALQLPARKEPLWIAVHNADQQAMALEARAFLTTGGRWLTVPTPEGDVTPQGWSPPVGKMMFLERHQELSRELGL